MKKFLLSARAVLPTLALFLAVLCVLLCAIHFRGGEAVPADAVTQVEEDPPLIALTFVVLLWGSDLPAWGTAKLGGKTVLYTHGHPFHVKFGLAELEQAAREAHADICLFGHTHQQMTDYRDGLYLMNPGAVAEGCYGMVDITPGGIMLLPCRL